MKSRVFGHDAFGASSYSWIPGACIFWSLLHACRITVVFFNYASVCLVSAAMSNSIIVSCNFFLMFIESIIVPSPAPQMPTEGAHLVIPPLN
jgi:hypothetical protein